MPSDDTRTALLLVVPLIVLEFLVSLFPMVYSFWLSIHKASLAGGVSSFVGVDNYLEIGSDTTIFSTAIVSVRFVAEVTILVFVISLGLALLLNENLRGNSLLKIVIILPWALSEYAVALTGRFFLDSNYGFINAILIRLHLVKYGVLFLNANNGVEWISLFYAWNFAPIGAFFILSSLQTVPDELYKAAKIDGASIASRFRLVTVPFIKYSILITVVLATIQAGGAIVIFFALTGGGPGYATTPVTLYDFIIFFRQGDYGYGSAISWLTLLFVASATTTYFYLLTRKRV